ncbi:MAG: HAD-IIIA family hydrolase [Verrucomicrobia bacterium]|nr:HAD-IIIA family hydrolase [Verrucomicrobiota bacterium]
MNNKPACPPEAAPEQAWKEIDVAGANAAALEEIPPPILAKFKEVKLFLCDVDGVLTDGGIYMGEGRELKRFHVRDGLGLRLLQRQGIPVGWISHRPSEATAERARDLGVDFLIQKPERKRDAVEEILRRTELQWRDLCYMGDDVVDLGVLRRAGLAVTAPDGLAEAKQLADYVTRAPAGSGAVREAAELILRAQGKWASVIREYAD